jgi:hypothetical protein
MVLRVSKTEAEPEIPTDTNEDDVHLERRPLSSTGLLRRIRRKRIKPPQGVYNTSVQSINEDIGIKRDRHRI